MTGGPGSVQPGVERDVADRLSAAKLWLVSTTSSTACGDLPYLATALYSLITIPTDRVATMTVDRLWRLYVNPLWVQTTEVDVLAVRLAHLVWHLLSEHADRGEDLDVHRASAPSWQTACDLTIAHLLPDLETGLPEASAFGLVPGRAAEEYYAALSGLPLRPADEADGGDSDDALDGPDASCGGGCDAQHRDYGLPLGADAGAVGQSHADAIRRQVAIEFREHQTQIGAEPGEWSRWIGSILDPVVPWRSVLASAVRRGIGWVHGQADYTYTRISRRQAAAGRVILPATRRPVPEVAVVVDTSGSVDDGLLAQAMGEVDGVLSGMGVAGSSVTVLATDAAVHAVSTVRNVADVRLGGGGGTDMTAGIVAALALRPQPNLVVVLTDGYTGWPRTAPAVPVVAAIIGRSRAELPPTPKWLIRVECVP